MTYTDRIIIMTIEIIILMLMLFLYVPNETLNTHEVTNLIVDPHTSYEHDTILPDTTSMVLVTTRMVLDTTSMVLVTTRMVQDATNMVLDITRMLLDTTRMVSRIIVTLVTNGSRNGIARHLESHVALRMILPIVPDTPL